VIARRCCASCSARVWRCRCWGQRRCSVRWHAASRVTDPGTIAQHHDCDTSWRRGDDTSRPLRTRAHWRGRDARRSTAGRDGDAWSVSRLGRPRDCARIAVGGGGESVVLQGWCAELAGFDLRGGWTHAVGEVHAVRDPRRGSGPGAARTGWPRAARVGAAGRRSLQPVDVALPGRVLLGDTARASLRGSPNSSARRGSHLSPRFVGREPWRCARAVVARPVCDARGSPRVGLLVAIVILVWIRHHDPMGSRRVAVLAQRSRCAIALLAGALGRPDHGLRVLVLAAIRVLMVDRYLCPVGLVISCGASLGIACSLFRSPSGSGVRRWSGGDGVTADSTDRP